MIKYEKTTWVDGETVLKADHVNNSPLSFA